MQAISQIGTANNLRECISELTPETFPNFCWECHTTQRTRLARYLTNRVKQGECSLFGISEPNGFLMGRVAVEIHPKYRSRGKPAVTFGWLDGCNAEIIQILLDKAVEWASQQFYEVAGIEHQVSYLRGPISFPKDLGGIGCQVEGFDHPRMYVVPTNRPELAKWIEAAHFHPDTPYACVDVSATPVWDSAPTELNGFKLVTFDQHEWERRKEEVCELGNLVFGDFLPDTVSDRVIEMLHSTAKLSPLIYSWPAALDSDGRLAAFIAALPNWWEGWDGHKITGLNVDSVIIHPQHRGKGLFSAIHNKGVADTRTHLGIRYFEGTTIWLANENAVKSIFPHGTICRQHVVFQRRLKRRIK